MAEGMPISQDHASPGRTSLPDDVAGGTEQPRRSLSATAGAVLQHQTVGVASIGFATICHRSR